MKRTFIFAICFFLLILLGMVIINFHVDFQEKLPEESKVGLILYGSSNDRSFSQAHYEGVRDAVLNINGLELIYRENVVSGGAFLDTVDELVNSGCRIIIATSYNYSDSIKVAADTYPYVYFFHAAGTYSQSNLTSFFGRMYQIRYLTGIVAGLQTKTGEIGYVAAFPIDEVNRGINAFMLGVSRVNPGAKVFVEWSGSWLNGGANRNAAERLIANHSIDVLSMHTDSLAPLEVAEKHSIYSIGYNFDNEMQFRSTYLTSAVWDWKEFYKPKISECLVGKLRGGHCWNGMETNIIRMTPLTDNVSNKDKVQYFLDWEIKKILVNNCDVFFGPIYDTDGNLRVPEGSCLTDESILNDFKWYVKGVCTSAF